MKILTIASLLVLILLIGAFSYFAFMDVPVAQKDIVKEIPHERFLEQ